MRCPFCDHPSTRVVDSRLSEPGDAVRRRRRCDSCGQRFTTYERVEAAPVTVRKRDGSRERFDRQKLIRGLARAANKRPVSDADLERLGDAIALRVRRIGAEVDAATIGELALRGLVELDPVSAILFASVYRNFGDLSELEAELHRIRAEPVAAEPAAGRSAEPVPSDPSATLGGPAANPVAARGAIDHGKG